MRESAVGIAHRLVFDLKQRLGGDLDFARGEADDGHVVRGVHDDAGDEAKDEDGDGADDDQERGGEGK